MSLHIYIRLARNGLNGYDHLDVLGCSTSHVAIANTTKLRYSPLVHSIYKDSYDG